MLGLDAGADSWHLGLVEFGRRLVVVNEAYLIWLHGSAVSSLAT
jgi:hypothetical protein